MHTTSTLVVSMDTLVRARSTQYADYELIVVCIVCIVLLWDSVC
jgi:hypothetical protein